MTTEERARHTIRAIARARHTRVAALEGRNVPMHSVGDLVGQTRSVGGAWALTGEGDSFSESLVSERKW